VNLISIRIRHTLQGSVIEFRSRLVDDTGRVSRSWGPWQVAYLHPESVKVPSGKQRVRAYVRRRVDNRRGVQ
jgi:hypothetical protein